MTAQELEAFLVQPHIARLACLDDTGHPYVVPCWFEHADGGFYVVPRKRSRWAQYLARDPRVSLSIDDSRPPCPRVLVRGHAELVEEPNVGGRWSSIGREMSKRYLGEAGPRYFEATIHEPRWLFFIRPLEIVSWKSGDWASRYKHPAAHGQE